MKKLLLDKVNVQGIKVLTYIVRRWLSQRGKSFENENR